MEKILIEIRSKYLNISKLQLNQYPFHMKKMATLELVSTEHTKSTEHSKGTDKRDEVCVSHQVRVNYCDLFKRQNDSKKVVILIEGEAGIGKTILCTLIIDDWASGRRFEEFFIALLLPLDQMNNSMASVTSVADLFSLLYDFNDDTSSCLVKHLKKHPSKILIIIDGWDQCPKAKYQQAYASFLNALIFENPFPRNSSVTMVITSRPGYRSPQFHQHISVKGFSSETIHACVASEFCSDRKIKCFSEQLENNPLVEDMCSVPLNLAIFLNIFKSCKSFPITLTELSTKVVWGLAQLSIKNSGKYEHIDELSCYDDIPRELQQSWWALCELAFKSIKECHAAFSESEASNHLSSELVAVSYFGTIKPNFVCEREGGFALYFLHPLIEEYLAAQHLARQRLTLLHLDECAQISHLSECFWKFFLSIYVNDTLSPDVSIISHCIQLVSKRHHCSDSGSLILCHYSFEAKSRIVDQEIIEALHATFASGSDSPVLYFGCQNAYDCTAVMYVIRSIEYECSMKINFRNCGIAEAQTLEFSRIIGNKEGKIQVKALDLSENRLSDSVVVDFVDHAAAALQSLEKLFLHNCGIGERSVHVFLELLPKTSPTLMVLDLSSNPLSASLLQIMKNYIASGTLMKLEILSLKGSLPMDINMHQLGDFSEALITHCPSFRQLDLSANNLGKPDDADLWKIISRFIDHRQDFDLRLNAEYMSEVDKKFISVMEDSIRTKGTIDHTIAHGVFVGPGRSGKDTLMKRLMGAEPPDADYISPSTGVLENIIKVEVKKMSTVAAAVSNLKWQRLEYDEEALELMMTTAKYHTVSSTSKPISIEHIFIDRSSSESLTLPIDTANQNPVTNKCDSRASMSDIYSENGNEEASSTRNVILYSSDIAPVEIFKKALKCRHMYALREHLESSWSLYLTNTGGQTEFQELLPILVCGPSVFFITFPLHHDLQKPYSVQYQHSNGKVKAYQSASTLIEELLQILATICALDYSKDHNVKCVPKVFFIGTHKDCLPACTAEQIIGGIDKQLQMHVKSTVLFLRSSIQFSQPHAPYRMIFTVNNLSKHDQDFQRIRLAVQQTVERKKEFTVTCPSSWLVFSLILRAKHKSIQTLHFDDCFNIAHECGISDRKELSAALSFIHSRLGLVRYFNVPELNQYIIVDPQILFDRITHLIVKTFTGDHADVNEIDDFYQRGIFPEEVVQRISEKCGFDLHLPSTWLTKLLNFIRIAALFIDRDNKKKYFFPAALSHAPKMCPQRVPSSINLPQPFLIAFKGGFCPRGIPGALIKYLMTNEMESKHHWELLASKVFRNQVSFRIGVYGSITLKIFPTYLEICVDTDSEEDFTDDDFMGICKETSVQIKKGVKVVTNQYFNNCRPFFGFYCTLDSCDSNPHPARIKGHGKNSKLSCTLNQSKYVRLPLAKGYQFWIIKKGSISVDKVIDSKHLGLIADLMAEWEGKISDSLELTKPDVAGIKTRYPSELNLQVREALTLWKERLSSNATYQALITAFESVGYRHYADQVKKLVIQPQDSDTDDSSCDEDPFPLPQPQTYPSRKSPSPVELPLPKSLPCVSYLVVDPENLPEGCILSLKDLASCNVTFVPKLSSNNKLSRPTSPKEYLEPPAAKKGKLASSEEESVLKDDTADIHVPSGAPGKPQAKEVTPTHIELSWTKPVTATDEEIMMYAVYFRQTASPKLLWERMQTNGPEESIIISDFVKGNVPFIFKVCAVNSSGEGAESKESDEILLTKVGVKGSIDETMSEDDEFQDSYTPYNKASSALYQQEAMDIDPSCTPNEAFDFLMENSLSCNLRVLGCQLGLKPSDLDTLLPLDQSHPYQQLLLQILSKCSERELLSWMKLVSVLRKPALKQSSESASLLSPRSGSLERLLMLSTSDDSAEPEISDVVNAIADVKDWEQLAISLGLTANDIDLIKQYDHREHHQRLAELWYDRSVDYSWGKLRRELDQFYPRRASDASVTSLSPEIESPQAQSQQLLLLSAAKRGDLQEVQSLLEDERTDINYQDSERYTALHFAAKEGHVEILDLLLKKGCNVNVTAGPKGCTPLQLVCLEREKPSKRRAEMVQLLLDYDTKLYIEDADGRTPLFAASRSGFVDVVQLILEKVKEMPQRKQRRALNHTMMNGWTPIMAAAMHGHAEVINLLLEAGATAIKTKEDDETALHIAAYHGHIEAVKVLTANQDRFVINARDQYGLTPLMMATMHGKVAAANVLLEAGADVNLQSNDKERRTALMFAAKNGIFSIVQLLLKFKPDVNIKDSSNKTALDLARSSEIRHCLKVAPETTRKERIESDMEGFDTRFEDIVSHHTIEGRSFFDDLRQLEFEEKAPI